MDRAPQSLGFSRTRFVLCVRCVFTCCRQWCVAFRGPQSGCAARSVLRVLLDLLHFASALDSEFCCAGVCFPACLPNYLLPADRLPYFAASLPPLSPIPHSPLTRIVTTFVQSLRHLLATSRSVVSSFRLDHIQRRPRWPATGVRNGVYVARFPLPSNRTLGFIVVIVITIVCSLRGYTHSCIRDWTPHAQQHARGLDVCRRPSNCAVL